MWPGDATWRHGSLSTLIQVMTLCLTTLSHDLKMLVYRQLDAGLYSSEILLKTQNFSVKIINFEVSSAK